MGLFSCCPYPWKAGGVDVADDSLSGSEARVASSAAAAGPSRSRARASTLASSLAPAGFARLCATTPKVFCNCATHRCTTPEGIIFPGDDLSPAPPELGAHALPAPLLGVASQCLVHNPTVHGVVLLPFRSPLPRCRGVDAPRNGAQRQRGLSFRAMTSV